MKFSIKDLTAAFVIAAMLAAQALVAFADTQKSPKKRRLTSEQQIIHVLNRLGFGARPGDVDRVKSIGLENYINQQLNPEKITDTVAENKVKDLGVLNMTTAELYEKYPQPGRLLRQLQARGMLDGNSTNPPDPQDEKTRKLLDDYYKQNGLQRPQRIMAELQASRILRAVYSERQL
ncbi:MAG TPA: DUF1800 family protein, partial [Pyrinomonadaceae bacterium]